MTLGHPSRLIVAIFMVAAFTALSIIVSCSQKPSSFVLRNTYAPVGFTTYYDIQAKRFGKTFKNDSLYREIDTRIEGDINYTTTEILENGNFMIREDNLLSWDEPVGDSGQMKRKTHEYTYMLEMTARGEVVNMESMTEENETWKTYARNFYEQAFMVFPEEAIAIGGQWTQSVAVQLPDSSTETAGCLYKVKGVARKDNYKCVIIDYQGNMVLPLVYSPEDPVTGVDRIEFSGILYFASDEGFIVSCEERRKYAGQRHVAKEDENYDLSTDLELVMSFKLDSASIAK